MKTPFENSPELRGGHQRQVEYDTCERDTGTFGDRNRGRQ